MWIAANQQIFFMQRSKKKLGLSLKKKKISIILKFYLIFNFYIANNKNKASKLEA